MGEKSFSVTKSRLTSRSIRMFRKWYHFLSLKNISCIPRRTHFCGRFRGQSLTARLQGQIGSNFLFFSKFLTQIFSRFPFWFLRRLPGNLALKTIQIFLLLRLIIVPTWNESAWRFRLWIPAFQSTVHILTVWFFERTLTAKDNSILWAFHRFYHCRNSQTEKWIYRRRQSKIRVQIISSLKINFKNACRGGKVMSQGWVRSIF